MGFEPGKSGNPATQFSATNQPEDRGRKISIKKQLKLLMEGPGTLTIKAKDIVKTTKDGDVIISLPNQELIALKLVNWITSTDPRASLKSIQLAMEQIDGKPRQSFSLDEGEEILPTLYHIIKKKTLKE